MLEPGLEPDEERVYRALLARPNATAMLLAEVLHRSRPTSRRPGPPRRVGTGDPHRRRTFVAAPPAMALGALITQRRDGLRMAEQALVTFAEEHRAAVAGRSISELIEVVTGVDAIRHRFLQVQQAARPRSGPSSPRRSSPCRPARTRPSRRGRPRRALPGGAGPGRAGRARHRIERRSTRCATAWNCGSPTSCR